MLGKFLQKSVCGMLSSASKMNMSLLSQEMKWNGLLHEKLFSHQASEYTTKLDPIEPKRMDKVKAFRCYDLEGNPTSPEYCEKMDKNLLVKMFEHMIKVDEYDQTLYMAQRQGKISFFMTSYGETAEATGIGAALEHQDVLFPQYREQGLFMWRGLTVEEMVNQCIGNSADKAKGRQMPIHYGSPKLNLQTISSPLGTQLPQASGAGYAFRMDKQDKLAVTFMGDGSASEGDFHSAMNFAATLKSQTLFICRNNGYAISVPCVDQYRGDGIVTRGIGYGIDALRVDGNDVIAVYNAVKFAREHIIKNKEPYLLEFMSYRIGDHSTSDQSLQYRVEKEIKSWGQQNDPLKRLQLYLKKAGIKEYKDSEITAMRKGFRKEVLNQMHKSEKIKFPKVEELFTDVYDQLPVNLKEQEQYLLDHLKNYGSYYKLNKFEK